MRKMNKRRKLLLIGAASLLTAGILVRLEYLRLKHEVGQTMEQVYAKRSSRPLDLSVAQWRYSYILERKRCACPGDRFMVGLLVDASHPGLPGWGFWTWSSASQCSIDCGDPSEIVATKVNTQQGAEGDAASRAP
jgi:hypothetical protein